VLSGLTNSPPNLLYDESNNQGDAVKQLTILVRD